MRKARVSIILNSVTDHFNGIHITLKTSDLDDITEEDIVARLRQCGGAHQPTSYDFESGVGAPILAPAPYPPPTPKTQNLSGNFGMEDNNAVSVYIFIY